MVEIVNLREEERKNAIAVHKDELLGLIGKELPKYRYQISNGSYPYSNGSYPYIILYGEDSNTGVARFALIEAVPCFTIIDESLEESVVKIAKQYESIIGKTVRINLDYQE